MKSTLVSLVASLLVLPVFLTHPAHAQLGAFQYSWEIQGPSLGLALDDANSVYAVSAARPMVANKYSPFGVLLQSFMTGYGVEAYGVGLMSNGDLVVADYYRTQVIRFAPDGTPIALWFVGGWRSAYLAVDEHDNVYVTDDEGDRVRKFSSAGVPLGDWPAAHPTGIAYVNGILYVAARNAGKIMRFSPSGTPMGEFPTGAVAAEQLGADNVGRLYLTDWGGFQLHCFTTDGLPLWTQGGDVPGYTYGPVRYHAVAMAPDGTAFIGDYDHDRVLVFASAPTASRSSSWGEIKQRYR